MVLLAGYVVKTGVSGAETQCPAVPDCWRGVGFSLSLPSIIQSVEIYHSQYDAPPQDDPGVANVVIRAVGGDFLPTGPNLVAKTVATMSCPLVAGYWFGSPVYKASVTFDTPLSLPAGNYALVMDTVIGGYGDRIDWWLRFASGWEWWEIVPNVSKNHRYLLLSSDGGVNWSENSSFEFMFKINGKEAPTVTTQAVSEISAATAIGNGDITALGNTVSQHGHCWSPSENPTISDSKTENGPAGATGAFTSAITGLTPDTLYHVRAYATNECGTSYGADRTFNTLPPAYKGNIVIDQLIYQHAERMRR